MEVRADRAELPTDPKALERVTLGDLVRRYRDTVSPRKKTAETEKIVLNAFLTRQICSRRLSELRTEDFAAYRDQRLRVIKPTSLKRELTPIRHLFEVARHEWGLPLRENPLDRLKLKAPEQRRERRLLNGEWDRLLEAARLCRNPWIEPIIRLALATGMRRGEILCQSAFKFDPGSASNFDPFERRVLTVALAYQRSGRRDHLAAQSIKRRRRA
jgi:integrase